VRGLDLPGNLDWQAGREDRYGVASEISADADRAKVSVSPSTRGDAVAWVSAELRAVQADW
jgi:hypothetical protein